MTEKLRLIIFMHYLFCAVWILISTDIYLLWTRVFLNEVVMILKNTENPKKKVDPLNSPPKVLASELKFSSRLYY